MPQYLSQNLACTLCSQACSPESESTASQSLKVLGFTFVLAAVEVY